MSVRLSVEEAWDTLGRAHTGIFTTLPPGAFTVILAGKGGGVGVGLIEVYNLQ